MLDGPLVAQRRVVGIQSELLERTALAQQVPVAIQLDPDLLEPLVLGGLEALRPMAAEQRVLLGDELLDVVLDLFVVHDLSVRHLCATVIMRPVLIRRETPADIQLVADVTSAAFARDDGELPVETRLLGELRPLDAWLPRLSLVAGSDDGELVGHVVCTRGHIGSAPALGLGPLSVRPDHQRQGVGSALVHAVLGAADALDEPVVVLLGDPGYYGRLGFRPAVRFGITPPVEAWADHFQARPLAAWDPALSGPFAYAEPFSRV